jgi:hypothetical protein
VRREIGNRSRGFLVATFLTALFVISSSEDDSSSSTFLPIRSSLSDDELGGLLALRLDIYVEKK